MYRKTIRKEKNMLDTGFVPVNRKITGYGWYDDLRATLILYHLILTANYENVKWHDTEIMRGQRVTSLIRLSEELMMPKTTVSDVLTRLEKRGLIERKATADFTIITLKCYDDYVSSVHSPSDTRTEAENKPSQFNKYNKKNNNNNSYPQSPNNSFLKSSLPSCNELENLAMERYRRKKE